MGVAWSVSCGRTRFTVASERPERSRGASAVRDRELKRVRVRDMHRLIRNNDIGLYHGHLHLQCTHVELIIVVSNQEALGVAMGVAVILD